jgi:heptosyltransferase III
VPRLFLLHQGGLGDFILSLPALLAILEHHQIPADLWTYSRHIPLLKYLPSRLTITGRSVEDPDLVPLYLESPKPAFLSQINDMSYVFGRKRNETFMHNLGAVTGGNFHFISTFPPEGSKVHVCDHQSMQLEVFGIKINLKYPILQYPVEVIGGSSIHSGERDLVKADQWLQDHGFTSPPLVCHVGSGSPRKNWPLPHFIRLLEWWKTRCAIPGVLIAGPAEEEMIGPPVKIPVARNLPLDLLSALLARSYGYIGNDSGVTHLAAALGIPTLALFGPSDPAVWAPRNPRVRVLKAENEMSSLNLDYVIRQAERFFGAFEAGQR